MTSVSSPWRGRSCRRRVPSWAVAALGVFMLWGSVSTAGPLPSSAILQELRSFRELGTLLFIAAHPDDEKGAFSEGLLRR